MANPNFPMAKRFIESQMRDQCRITRDTGGTQDDTLDETTGALTSPTLKNVYSGKCDVKEISRLESMVDVAGHEQWNKRYKILVPLDVVNVRQGDILTVTTAVLDPRLQGHKFKIQDVSMTTNRTYRQLDAMDMDFRIQVPD